MDYWIIFVPETTKLILKKEKKVIFKILNYSYKWNCPIRFIYHEIIFKDIDTFEKYCNCLLHDKFAVYERMEEGEREREGDKKTEANFINFLLTIYCIIY